VKRKKGKRPSFSLSLSAFQTRTMGAACCRPSAADDSYDAGGAIKEKQGSNGGLSGARRGKREREMERWRQEAIVCLFSSPLTFSFSRCCS